MPIPSKFMKIEVFAHRVVFSEYIMPQVENEVGNFYTV
jgi:hypothetical protein